MRLKEKREYQSKYLTFHEVEELALLYLKSQDIRFASTKSLVKWYFEAKKELEQYLPPENFPQ